MNKKLAMALASVTAASGLMLAAPPAQAAPTPHPTATPAALSCKDIGRVNILITDPGYIETLDGDADGVMCEQPGNGISGLTDRRTCPDLGRTDIRVGERDYVLSRDKDRDGIACESSGQDGPVATRMASSPTQTPMPTRPAPLAAPMKDNHGGLAKTGR